MHDADTVSVSAHASLMTATACMVVLVEGDAWSFTCDL